MKSETSETGETRNVAAGFSLRSWIGENATEVCR